VWRGREGKGPIAKFLPPDVQPVVSLRAQGWHGPAIACSLPPDKPAAAAKHRGCRASEDRRGARAIDQGPFEFCGTSIFPLRDGTRRRREIEFSQTRFSMPKQGAGRIPRSSIPPIASGFFCAQAIQVRLSFLKRDRAGSPAPSAIHRTRRHAKAFAIDGKASTARAEIRRHVRALSLGAPPHGGIAPGLDECDADVRRRNLREVVSSDEPAPEELIDGGASESSQEPASAHQAGPARR